MAVDPFGLTGLFVALVALIIALLQVLQALFATADGYRNCRPAIMGDWGNPKLTRRKFVPGEMRFETIYTVPYITMSEGVIAGNTFHIDGSNTSRVSTHCTAHNDPWWRSYNTTGEMVTWVSLLDQVHNLGAADSKPLKIPPVYQAKAELPFSSYSIPTLTMRERSWDFTPREVNKPLAGEQALLSHCVIGAETMMVVINLTGAAILIRRLGMTWTLFEPSKSLLQAEGRGMVVNSINVPAVGTVLEFNRAERKPHNMTQKELLVSGRDSDALGFGIVRPWSRNDGFYFRMGTSDDYTNTIGSYCSPRDQKASDLLKSNPMIRCFGDFVGLTARVMFIKGTQINRIPDPSPNSRGILNSSAASFVLRERIFGYTSEHQHDMLDSDLKHLQWIQKTWVDLFQLKAWILEALRSHTNSEDQKLLNTLHDTIRELDSWLFTKMHREYQIFVNQHLAMVLSCEERVTEATRELHLRPMPDGVDNYLGCHLDCEIMQQYVDHVEDLGKWGFLHPKFGCDFFDVSKNEFVNPLQDEKNEVLRIT